MGFGGSRLCLCLLLAFALISSARNNIPFSGIRCLSLESIGKMGGVRRILKFVVQHQLGFWLHDDEVVVAMEGRSLMVVRTDDYSDPTANRGHDPSSSSSFSRDKAGGRGGRKG